MKVKLIKGAIFVTVATLLVKILSIVYKIPYQNITGNKGFYIYQQLYPIYALAVASSSFAFPLVLSENIVKEKDVKRWISSFFYFILSICLVLSLFFLFAHHDLGKLMGDEKLSNLFLPLIPVLLVIPFLSVLRGYLYSQVEWLNKVGISIVVEQFFRVSVIILILYSFLQDYIHDIYRVAHYSFYGFSVGLIFASLYLILYFRVALLNYQFVDFKIGWQILKRGLFLLISSSILLLLQLIDSFTIINQLRFQIPLENAMNIKGIYDRSLPIIQTAVFFVPPLLSSMIPHIKNKVDENKLITLIFYLSLPATLGLILVLKQVNFLLFHDTQYTFVLQINAALVILYSLILTLTSLMKNNRLNLVILFFGFLVKILFNVVLIRHYGISGAAISSMISLTVILLLLLFNYKKSISLNFILLLKIVVASGFMFIVVTIINLYDHHLILKIISGIISYLLMSIILKIKKENFIINYHVNT